ncbi:uncharacterized protein LOC119076737 [Bradysia coprophila]|uniref:uncharacterized protein LOC119076737 n=1 Tax=Bradysia coprophila TaxID=38358 RepID=UPI00187D8DB3|nr:uncharacterized protein LOC119076737 [Bradysia coprophila]
MSDNIENRRQTRRISSILKNVVTSDESPTQTFSRRSKRISFSHVNNVKEFVADVDNQTIWGDSYEKSNTAKNLSNSGSVSQIPTLDSVATASNSVAVAPTIDLFADIENGSAEMEISQRDSVSHTKLFNQTMIVEETVSTSSTSVTNCKLVDMSGIVGNANKRKTIDTISVETVATDVVKSVKIRKMNDENLEPGMYNTILHHVNMSVSSPDRKSGTKSQVNLNTTRMFDDAEMSDVSLPQTTLSDDKSVRPSKRLERTTALTSIDEPSITSFVSDTSIPTSQKTHIFGRGDISAAIDQTFAVRNPLQEDNAAGWNGADKLDDTEKETAGDHEMGGNEPAFQSISGISRHRTLEEDLTISMDIQFKNHPLSPHSLNPDEPAIEDLTIFLDTNFQAEVSGEIDDGAMSKLAGSRSPSECTKNSSLKPLSLSNREPLNELPGAANKENVFTNSSAQLSHGQNTQDLTNLISKDLSLNPIEYVACREKTLLPTFDPTALYDSANEKLPKAKFLDYSTSHDQVLATEFSFAAHSDPLSSTRFVPNNQFPQNFSNIDTHQKANCSSVTFNDCPTLNTRQSQDMRSATSLQNNTDELCNLEPYQLKKTNDAKPSFMDLSQTKSNNMLSETNSDSIDIIDFESLNDLPVESRMSAAKKYFMNLSQNASNDMLSETKMDLIASTDESVNIVELSAEATTDVHKLPRCRKCMNCRESLGGGNATFAGVGESDDKPKLDFSMYEKLKGLPTMRDVIAARKKREAAREMEDLLLVDQNVEAPDIRLWLLNNCSETTAEPRPVYVPEPLICYPMRMNIKYLMNNKMKTEYPQWKYNDNFFQIGTIALRYDDIPSIVIHIKFEVDAPMKAEQFNMPLLFSRILIEQCPTHLRRISTEGLLKHNNSFSLLPSNLLSLMSSSENIFRGLEEIEKRFRSVIVKIKEFDEITIRHGALVRMGTDGTCYVEKTLFDIKKLLMQEVKIEFDNVDMVGPGNVTFDPFRETTDAFKALPSGLSFLRSFLSDPMSYMAPIADV